MEREGEKKEAQEHTSVISVFAPWWGVGEEVKSRKRNSQRKKQIFGAALMQTSFKTTCRNVFTLTRYTNTALGRWLTDFS